MDRGRATGKLRYRDSAMQFINAMPMPSILGEELILRIDKESGDIQARLSAPHMPLYSFVEIHKRLFEWVADVHGFNILPKADYFELAPPEIISRLDASDYRGKWVEAATWHGFDCVDSQWQAVLLEA